MSTSLVDHFKVDIERFEASGALDPILDVDTRLFIDPSLLRTNKVPELKTSYQKVTDHFSDVLKIVRNIKEIGDRMWRQADKMLTFPEVKGLCIGYSNKGVNGSGMGPSLRKRLLETVIEIVRSGNTDPALFELVGIFEDNIGPDRISDMIAKIIVEDLICFTQRVCSDCSIPMKAHRIEKMGIEEDLPFNPITDNPIILVPKEILMNLPVAESFSDIRWIAEKNQALRDELNALIGITWRKATLSEQKKIIREWFVDYPDVLQKVIASYRGTEAKNYDFDDDPAGEVIWYRVSKNVAKAAPLSLELSNNPDLDEVEALATAICIHFQRLIEDNQLARLLYDKDGYRKHESAAQLLFFGIAAAYCEANNLDLSPECDSGRGPVDFKVSRGFKGKVLVEIKLTSNPQLIHGFQKQLPIYQKAEKETRGIYLVIDNGGASTARINSFRKIIADTQDNCPKVIWVDGILRASASKADE